jgi:hypothetical protein
LAIDHANALKEAAERQTLAKRRQGRAAEEREVPELAAEGPLDSEASSKATPLKISPNSMPRIVG